MLKLLLTINSHYALYLHNVTITEDLKDEYDDVHNTHQKTRWGRE